MKETGIPFTAESVRAILAGKKSQTRRVIKPQPELMNLSDTGRAPYEKPHWCMYPDSPDGRKRAAWPVGEPPYFQHCPYGQPGDRLWVRENGWEPKVPSIGEIAAGADTWPRYAYDADGISEGEAEDFRDWGWKRRPSIFMPRRASRITLEITGIRVQQLRAISMPDARVEIPERCEFCHKGYGCLLTEHPNCIDRFVMYWNAINAKRGFGSEKNPWVWVIEFGKLTRKRLAA